MPAIGSSADQHGVGDAFAFAHEVQAPVNAVGAVDIGVARPAEHHGIAHGLPAKAMRRRILVIIGLDLNDAAADPVDEQCGANQLRGHKMHGAGKEVSTKLVGG